MPTIGAGHTYTYLRSIQWEVLERLDTELLNNWDLVVDDGRSLGQRDVGEVGKISWE